MEILVVGAGAMGRWFGEVLQSAEPETVSVSFLDVDHENARDAAATVGGRAISAETDETFDLLCIAVPIPAATEAIATYSKNVEHAIVDVTGTMADPVNAMAEHASECERASLHPLFSPANEPGNIPVVVDSGGPLTDRVLAALRARENEVFETTVERHDEAMETVQARTHAAILAFGLSASAVSSRFQTTISAELSDLTEQVTDGESRVYADIQSAFEGADDVADAARQIADADRETFEMLYEQARIQREDNADGDPRVDSEDNN